MSEVLPLFVVNSPIIPPQTRAPPFLQAVAVDIPFPHFLGGKSVI